MDILLMNHRRFAMPDLVMCLFVGLLVVLTSCSEKMDTDPAEIGGAALLTNCLPTLQEANVIELALAESINIHDLILLQRVHGVNGMSVTERFDESCSQWCIDVVHLQLGATLSSSEIPSRIVGFSFEQIGTNRFKVSSSLNRVSREFGNVFIRANQIGGDSEDGLVASGNVVFCEGVSRTVAADRAMLRLSDNGEWQGSLTGNVFVKSADGPHFRTETLRVSFKPGGIGVTQP